ncbi:hypothetical protein RJ640_018747, partial [Escallonia rubra]
IICILRNILVFLMDFEGASLNPFPIEPLATHHFLSQISSFVDNYHSRYLYVPGSLALQEAFNCISKFAGGLFLWFASGSNSNINRNLPGSSHASNPRSCKASAQLNHVNSSRQTFKGFCCSFRIRGESSIPVFLGKISRFTMRQLCKEAKQLQSLHVLSLAAALVPPLDNISQNVLAVPLENSQILAHRCMDRGPCAVEQREFDDITSSLNCTRHAVEPRTGIQFPTILDNLLAGETNSNFLSEVSMEVVLPARVRIFVQESKEDVVCLPMVLVGTGSRTMRIIKIKSLKVYAFGFYVHPYDVCKKLGSKYASIPATDMNKHQNFYKDLLREDISMTVRLVVSCNGMKISTVKEAFEKSLRARLVKTNPDTDYDCLRTFGSLFSQDIPIRAGTTIDFRRTVHGHLITEIGGNQIGVVQSKDLCRAFFDMYIGDVPVCERTKEDIGRNVASIIRRC